MGKYKDCQLWFPSPSQVKTSTEKSRDSDSYVRKLYVITKVYKCNMIVSNASTLILLAKVSVIRKFLDEYGEITIPNEVEKEITEGNTFDSKILGKEIEDKHIIVKAIKSNTSKILKEFRMHKGEAEAYILYNEYHAKAILTDDGELIKLCKLFEIPFINALSIITRMFEKGVLTQAEACEYLQKLNDYGRYSKEVYNYFKQEVNCP